MKTQNFIGYVRVSTAEQSKSGLGLSAQREAIAAYLKGQDGKLIEVLEEVESGKNDARPKLQAAIATCRRTNGTLVIARLDRLSRDLAFIAVMMKSGVSFVCCDNPHATSLTLHIFGAMAEHERTLISERTKSALAAAKAKGVKLGNPRGLSGMAMERSKEARKMNADRFAQELRPHIAKYVDLGLSLNEIARRLNEDGTASPRGGRFTARSVQNLLTRLESGERQESNEQC